MYQGGVMLVLLSFILWIAAGISDWRITESPLQSGLIVPLSGFSVGGIIAGALSWLVGMLMVLASGDSRKADAWLRPGLAMLGIAMVLMLVSAISGWETIDLVIASVLFVSGETLPMGTLILSLVAGLLGSLLVVASYGTPSGTSEGSPSHETRIAQQHGTTAARQQAFREIARAQGELRRQDQESRIETLERELAALKAASGTGNADVPADEAEDGAGDLASERSKEIAELIRRANQD